jgi:predicted PurR-regulated permease PerM/methylmalonyl-CoA mutase cobalamin-binding subunit
MQNSLAAPKRKITATEALAGLWTISLAAFVVATLYFTRDILIPLALAALLTFLLSPLVARIERWVGRVAAVLVVVLMIFGFTGMAGWVFTRQLVDLARKLPDYKANMAQKLQALKVPSGGAFSRLSDTFEDLKKQLPGANAPAIGGTSGRPTLDTSKNAEHPTPVQIVNSGNAGPVQLVEAIVAPLMGPLGTTALVAVLAVCMLLQREDLRSRLIRLVGQGHISATTTAMDDAGARVSRYLLMQLVVNVTYGLPIGIGLYFIGVPNAPLWGVFAATLRFIPYVGAWIASAFPIILSLAVSTSWTMPILTIGLFITLELIISNVLEPWLYGASTGVSTIALIVAAVFWTWLWGPIGLVLATPLTVCLVVMGRHVPRLQFLSIVLSDDEALTPSEECYHRLLAGGLNETSEFLDSYVKANSLTALYDNVLIPVVTSAELDTQNEALDDERRVVIEQSVRDIVEDLGSRPAPASKVTADVAVAEHTPPPAPMPAWRIHCLPARADRDELAGAMLAHLLREQGFHAENAPAKLVAGELVKAVEQTDADAVCISVVAPSTVIHARYLTTKLRTQFPALKIVVGLWGATEAISEAAKRLRESGANEIVTTLADAVVQLAKLAPTTEWETKSAPIPEDDEQRLAALSALHLLQSPTDPSLDRVTRRIARIFDVPIALITLVDADRQYFKGQTGLREDLAAARESPRATSVCGHVVASNEVLVVEDLARDRRFAGNPFLKAHGLRFYAGVPLRAPNGQPIGSLCILDTKPRSVTDRELRLLHLTAEEVMEEIANRSRSAPLGSAEPVPMQT